MSTKILINATHPEEVRVGIQKNNELHNYDNDKLDNINKKGCVFKGIVSRVESSLDAAFVDFGRAKHGFLPLSEVMRSHPKLEKNSEQQTDESQENKKPGIGDYLKEGQHIIVQVEKDERGTKGAALTTNISLAGCFVVLMPNTAGAGGISRQIEGEDREQLKRILNQIDVPSTHSLILRTASVNKTLEELLWDYNVLVSQWDAIVEFAQDAQKPLLLYKEGALLQRTIRDYLKPDVDSIIVDQKSTYDEVLALVQHARPDFLEKVQLYEDQKVTLFDAYHLESDVESLYNSEISMSNGATLVIDHCEALTAIDINSAKATDQSDIDETAFQINQAAALEIARQVRLRNLGGQIVIDFIDMATNEQRREVEKVLKQALDQDKARIQIGSICDKLGLLAFSRQRMNTSLDESSLVKCRHCRGHGVHRRALSVALSAIRMLKSQARTLKGHFPQITIKVSAEIAELLYNKYRKELASFEDHYNTLVNIIISSEMGTADYEIEFQRKSSAPRVYRNFGKPAPSAEERELLVPAVKAVQPKKKEEENAVSPAEKVGILTRIYNAFFGFGSQKATQSDVEHQKKKRRYQKRGKKPSSRVNQDKNTRSADNSKNHDKPSRSQQDSSERENDNHRSEGQRSSNRRRRSSQHSNGQNRRRQNSGNSRRVNSETTETKSS